MQRFGEFVFAVVKGSPNSRCMVRVSSSHVLWQLGVSGVAQQLITVAIISYTVL